MSVIAEPQELRLANEVDEAGLIQDRTFENVVILGPALLVPIEDVTFDSNTFVVDPAALFIELPEGAPIQGGIGLKRVTFRRCELRNVAIAGSPETLTPIRAQFEFPESSTLVAQR